MTKEHKKIVEYHCNELAKYYWDMIESDADTIRHILHQLTDLAMYNAEMEDAEIRADRADDMRRSIEIRLEEITENVKEITRGIEGGWKMQEWYKRDDECNAYFSMTEEELEEIMQRREETDVPEDPELTEEQEAMYRAIEEETLERLRRTYID